MRLTTIILVVTMAWFSSAKAADPQVGGLAPEFALMDQHGKSHTVSDYRGRWLVVYFYPKDDTPGCTTEACEFRDDILVLRRMGVALVGISTDDVASHKEFAEKYHLPFPLLSDPEGQTAAAYGSVLNLGLVTFAKRHSFIIDPHGRVAKIYRSVNSKRHSDEVIADLRSLGVVEKG